MIFQFAISRRMAETVDFPQPGPPVKAYFFKIDFLGLQVKQKDGITGTEHSSFRGLQRIQSGEMEKIFSGHPDDFRMVKRGNPDLVLCCHAKKIDVFFDLWEHLPVNSAILYTGNGILSSPEMNFF